MPQTTYTAYDTSGQTKLTDMDMLAEQRRREMQDQAFRGALLNNQNNMQREGWGRQDALTERNLGAQERIAQMGNQTQLAMGGTFQDRTAANQALAAQQMRPAQTLADLELNKWSEGAALRKAKAEGEIGRLNFENNIFGQISGGGPGGQPMDPKQLRIAMAFMNKDASLLKDPFDQDFRDVVKAQLNSGAMSPEEAMAALKSGEPALLRSKQVSPFKSADVGGELAAAATGFGEADDATIGWDPTSENEARILSLIGRHAQALRAENPRISDAQAMDAAIAIVERSLAPYMNSLNTGPTRALMQKLRSGGGSMMNAQIGGMGSTSDRGY